MELSTYIFIKAGFMLFVSFILTLISITCYFKSAKIKDTEQKAIFEVLAFFISIPGILLIIFGTCEIFAGIKLFVIE